MLPLREKFQYFTKILESNLLHIPIVGIREQYISIFATLNRTIHMYAYLWYKLCFILRNCQKRPNCFHYFIMLFIQMVKINLYYLESVLQCSNISENLKFIEKVGGPCSHGKRVKDSTDFSAIF